MTTKEWVLDRIAQARKTTLRRQQDKKADIGRYLRDSQFYNASSGAAVVLAYEIIADELQALAEVIDCDWPSNPPKPEIHPCISCGSGRWATVPKGPGEQVLCRDCGMRGPIKPTEAEAIAAWNSLGGAK